MTFQIFIFLAALLPQDYVEKLIQERVESGYNVGIVVAIIEPEKTCFYSFGKTSKNPEAKQVNEKTLFPLASITKVFTTLLLAEDVENGLVKLSDPANKYLPPSMQLPDYHGTEITLEDLATHTSGFAKFGDSFPKRLYEDFNQERLSLLLKTYKLQTKPGTRYEYSDVIGLLGDISANIAHKTYEQQLTEKILLPLKMEHTKLLAFPMRADMTVIGYNAADQAETPFNFPILEPAGALYSTAEDLTKFLSANLGFTKTSLYPAMKLTHQPIHSQGKPLIDFDFPGIENLEIGLGWNIDQEHNLIWKNGNFPSFSSFIGFNSKTRRGVIVLANTGNILYTDNLALHLLNSKIELFPLYHEATISKKILDKYAGKYSIGDEKYYIFISENNYLKTQYVNKDYISEFFNIYPMSETQFFGRVANAIFTFSEIEGQMRFILEEGQEKQLGIRQ